MATDGPAAALDAALARDDPTAVMGALDQQFHHRRPGSHAALRQQVGKQLAAALAGDGSRESRWIDVLAPSPLPSARQVACLLLANRYRSWARDPDRAPTAQLVGRPADGSL